MEFHSAVAIIGLCIIGLLLWLIADLKHALRWGRELTELQLREEQDAVTRHFEKELQSYRPMLRLFRAFNGPGSVESEYALHLSNLGLQERALHWVNRAIRKRFWRNKICSNKLRIRALIYCRTGRYTDAEADVALARANLQNIQESHLDDLEGIILLYTGHLDESLAMAKTAIQKSQGSDVTHLLASNALQLMGRFQDALDILAYQPSNVLACFEPKSLEQVTSTEDGQKMVLSMDERLAGVARPGRFLEMSNVCLEAGDAQTAKNALARAHAEIKSNLTIQHLYLRLRACCFAMEGHKPEAMDCLEKLRVLSQKLTERSANYGLHMAAGRSSFLLMLYELAYSELQEALKYSLHPIEKHATNYWLGRVAEACGNFEDMQRCLSLVVSDGFATWMESDARARLKNDISPGSLSTSLRLRLPC